MGSTSTATVSPVTLVSTWPAMLTAGVTVGGVGGVSVAGVSVVSLSGVVVTGCSVLGSGLGLLNLVVLLVLLGLDGEGGL